MHQAIHLRCCVSFEGYDLVGAALSVVEALEDRS